MTYTPNVPQANQTIAQTQSPILNNFTYIEDALERDHAWQGNIIGTEAPGRHQTVSMPNQGADIAALPTGCAAVQYTIDGHMYTWNGVRNPLSGVSGNVQGTFNIGIGATAVFTVPNNCIGFLMITNGTATSVTLPFMAVPALIIGTPTQSATSGPTFLAFSQSGNNIRVQCAAGAINNQSYKYIYWPI